MSVKSVAPLVARFTSVSIGSLAVAALVLVVVRPQLVTSISSYADETVIVETITSAPTMSTASAIAIIVSSLLALLVLGGMRWPSVIAGAIATVCWGVAISSAPTSPDSWNEPGGILTWCWLALTLLASTATAVRAPDRSLRDMLVGVVLGVAVAQSFGYFDDFAPAAVVAWIPGGLAGALLLMLGALVIARTSAKSAAVIALVPLAIVWTVVVTDRVMPPGPIPLIDTFGFAALLGVLVVLAVAGVGWALGSRRRRPMTP